MVNLSFNHSQVAACCLQDKQGRWLQIRFAEGTPAEGKIGFPGGKIETGESIRTAAIREAHEELGVKVEPVNLILTCDLSEWDVRLHAMLCRTEARIFNVSEREVSEILWLTTQEIQEHPDALRSSVILSAALPSAPPSPKCLICHGAGEPVCSTGEHELTWCRCRLLE